MIQLPPRPQARPGLRRGRATMSVALPAPYGGALVNPVMDPGRAADRLRAITQAPSWDLTASQATELELLLTGAFSPLRGYMNRENADRCREDSRLADGTLWPVPVSLSVSDAIGRTLEARRPLVLRDLEGVPLALLSVDEAWQTPSTSAASSERTWWVSGLVEGLRLPIHHDFSNLRLAPAAARREMTSRGWGRALAVPVAGVLSPAAVSSAVVAAERLGAGLVLMVLMPTTAPGDADHFDRVRAARDAMSAAPADRALLALVPWRMEGPAARDWVARAIVARNFGCSHLAHPPEIAIPDAEEIGVVPVALNLGPAAHDARADRLDPPATRGFTVFLTGLSGSGKSTIANILRARLQERGPRKVSLLDGDLVRKHLSSELGFSREHRDLNIRRIAYVASEITRHGGIAICAPIAPYEQVRAEARRLIEAVGDFILVFVDTPLEVCEARDLKGLYAKARAGLLPAFTGISDPYERPGHADLVLDTTRTSAEQAADQIVRSLEMRGYFGPSS